MNKLSPSQRILRVLAYSSYLDHERIEAKLRYLRRSTKYNLVPEEKMVFLRFVAELENEIRKATKSKYFNKKKPDSGFSDVGDFNLEKLSSDFSRTYPDISAEEIRLFVPFSVLINYVR